jgi:hypothetical protein
MRNLVFFLMTRLFAYASLLNMMKGIKSNWSQTAQGAKFNTRLAQNDRAPMRLLHMARRMRDHYDLIEIQELELASSINKAKLTAARYKTAAKERALKERVFTPCAILRKASARSYRKRVYK